MESQSFLQLVVVLVLFFVILLVTAMTTKWIAVYQKQHSTDRNIEIIDMMRIPNNKMIQIIRVGRKYIAIAVCKDTVTMLCEIPEEQVVLFNIKGEQEGFKEVLQTILKKKETGVSD